MAMGAGLHAGRFGGDTLRRAAEGARRLPPGDDFVGLMLIGLAAWVLDPFSSSAPLLRRALDAIDVDRDLRLLWVAVPAAIEVFRGTTTDSLSEDAVRAARATGSLSRLPSALVFRAGTLTMRGRFADAAGLLDEAESLARATGVAFPASATITLAALRGRKEDTLDLIDTAVRESRERGEGVRLGQAGYAKALLYNGLADYPAAMGAALEATEHIDIGIGRDALAELVEAAVRAGKPEVAASARRRLIRWTSAVDSDWARGIEAVADALTGSPAQAESRYRKAIDTLTASRHDVLATRARLLYGEWLRRESRREDARTILRSVYEAFTVMGAEAFATRAGRELVAAGGTLRTPEGSRYADLTNQESQIARLAVAGHTNPEIGAELFISPRTVEWHLRKIFVKLGVSSRRELPGALRG
jgi:DNA-binding CsgD family transcriptional regulator